MPLHFTGLTDNTRKSQGHKMLIQVQPSTIEI